MENKVILVDSVESLNRFREFFTTFAEKYELKFSTLDRNELEDQLVELTHAIDQLQMIALDE